ncbi:hypothetical protein [Streptomyces sp. B1I3]|nr:hypothetical protein [Streptomyces sp. B1I3]MDQ0791995.1 hypothetical protein [Streptomyces sp. B1I3]
MNAARHIARTHRAARTATRPLGYRCLSGQIATAVDQGTLIPLRRG